ncbi:MAG: DUF4920 domain-containing protein [Bacteroidota bacterium]
MKFSFVFLLVLALSATAGEKKKYGKPLTLKEKTPISVILSQPEKFDGKRVQVEGTVVGVCAKQGCWIKIAEGKDSASIRFKVEDGVIVFPTSLKGKQVVAEGIVSVKTQSKEELIQHVEKHAKEEGTTFDSSAVTGPQTTIQLQGEGVVVVR